MKYTIYCDMDGVLADFKRGVSEFFYDGHEWDKLERRYGAEHWQKEFIKPIQIHGKFWENLPLYPGAMLLWNYIKPFNPFILSAYPSWDEEGAQRGKKLWLARHVRVPESRVLLVDRHEKQLYATPTSILIDDYDKNIREWTSKGGIGIHYLNAPQAISALSKLGIG